MGKIKTLKDWEKSGLDLDEYLTKPCEINEELFRYIGDLVPPSYVSQQFIQDGGASHEEDGVLFYTTVSHIGDKYFYLGILPEFKK